MALSSEIAIVMAKVGKLVLEAKAEEQTEVALHLDKAERSLRKARAAVRKEERQIIDLKDEPQPDEYVPEQQAPAKARRAARRKKRVEL